MKNFKFLILCLVLFLLTSSYSWSDSSVNFDPEEPCYVYRGHGTYSEAQAIAYKLSQAGEDPVIITGHDGNGNVIWIVVTECDDKVN